MNTSMPRPNDPASRRAGAPAAPECLDENLLAAYAEQRLDEPRRERVEAHLAACDACRDVALALHPATALGREEVTPAADAGQRPAFRRLRPLLALAAAAAVLVGAVLALRAREPASAASFSEQLTASAARARGARPDLLGDFRPYGLAELRPAAPAALRGGVLLYRPAEAVLASPEEVAFAPVPGALEYAVSILRADGTRLWSVTTRATRVAWPAGQPPLAPGTHALVEVVADGALGRSEARRAFTVADAVGARRYEDAAQALAAEAPQAAALLRAHLALRLGLLEEAERAARAFAASAPGEPLGRATLDHVAARLGLAAASDPDPPR